MTDNEKEELKNWCNRRGGSMIDNQKLHLWQAGILGNPDELQVTYNIPDYLNDDAAAMSLLDTLVEKGLIWSLYGQPEGIMCKVYKMPDAVAVSGWKPTRREAVVEAVLELIGKELVG